MCSYAGSLDCSMILHLDAQDFSSVLHLETSSSIACSYVEHFLLFLL